MTNVIGFKMEDIEIATGKGIVKAIALPCSECNKPANFGIAQSISEKPLTYEMVMLCQDCMDKMEFSVRLETGK